MLTPILGFETRGFVGLEHALSWGRPMSTLAIWWGSCSADQLGIAGLGMDYREGWRAIVSVIERKTELVSGELQNDHLAPEWRSLTRIKQHILDQAGLRAVMHTLIITCNREIVFFAYFGGLYPPPTACLVMTPPQMIAANPISESAVSMSPNSSAARRTLKPVPQ